MGSKQSRPIERHEEIITQILRTQSESLHQMTEMQRDIRQNTETGRQLREEVSEVNNKLVVLSMEIEKAKEERETAKEERETAKEERKTAKEERLKSENELKKIKLQIENEKTKRENGEEALQRTAVTTANKIRELTKLGLSSKQFNLVLEKIILETQRTTLNDQNHDDEEYTEGVDELDRECDEFSCRFEMNAHQGWTQRQTSHYF